MACRRDVLARRLALDALADHGAHLTTDAPLPTDGPYAKGVARLERLGGAGTWMASTDTVAEMVDSVTSADQVTMAYPAVMTDQYGWGHTGTVDGAEACAWRLEGGRTTVVAIVAGNRPGQRRAPVRPDPPRPRRRPRPRRPRHPSPPPRLTSDVHRVGGLRGTRGGAGTFAAMPGSILGTRVVRTEDPELLVGGAQYVSDLPLEHPLLPRLRPLGDGPRADHRDRHGRRRADARRRRRVDRRRPRRARRTTGWSRCTTTSPGRRWPSTGCASSATPSPRCSPSRPPRRATRPMR